LGQRFPEKELGGKAEETKNDDKQKQEEHDCTYSSRHRLLVSDLGKISHLGRYNAFPLLTIAKSLSRAHFKKMPFLQLAVAIGTQQVA
jgi:hypothetical protein